MLEDGLSYPVRGEWVGRTAIGGILGLLSAFVLPAFFITGYLISVLETTVAGESDPPAFEDWGDLFVKGFVGTVITIIYSILPIVVFGGIGSVISGTGGLVGGEGGSALAVLGGLTWLLLLPALFLVYYIVPAALTNYAIEERFGAAFDFGAIKPILLSGDYLVAVLAPIVIGLLLWLVTVILVFTFVGVLLIPFVQFYGQVAVFRMFGLAFKRVSEGETATQAAV